MDRDRDEQRRLPPRGRDPAAAKFDPAEWDTPVAPTPAPVPSPAERARSGADTAQAYSFFSSLDTKVQQILAGFGTMRDLYADIRARLADNAARDAARAEAEEARDAAITARLVHPDTLAHHANAGARQGVRETIDSTIAELKRYLDAETAAREQLNRQVAASYADRHAYDVRRHRFDRLRNAGLAASALLVPIGTGLGYYLGHDAGTASSYARSRDEVAAASWANTPNGKLARQIDQASQMTLPDIADCPSDNGWHTEKRKGVRYCFATNPDRKPIIGWTLP